MTAELRKTNKGISPILMFIIFVGCLASAVLYSLSNSSMLGLLTTVIICATVIFSEETECYYFLFGLQFVSVVIPVSLGSSKLGFIIFAYVALTLKSIVNKRTVTADAVFAIVLLVLDMMTSAFSNIYKVGDNINWVASLIFMIYVVRNLSEKVDFNKILTYFCLAEWCICIINIIFEFEIFGKSLVPEMYGGTYSEILDDYIMFGKAYPNIAGGNAIVLFNVLAIALCILQFNKTENIFQKIFYVVSVAFFAYTGALVVSRAFYIELIIFIALFILAQCKSLKNIFITLLIFGIVALVFYAYVYEEVLPLLKEVLLRFDKGNENRTELLKQASDLVTSNIKVMLIGGGSYYPETYGFTAHNILFDSLVSLGLIGSLVYWGIIAEAGIISVKKAFKVSNPGIRAFIPLSMFAVYRLISGRVSDVFAYYLLSLCYVYIVVVAKECANEKK